MPILPHIIKQDRQEDRQQIQLEIPDYSAEYYEWLKKQQIEQDNSTNETVIIIDIY